MPTLLILVSLSAPTEVQGGAVIVDGRVHRGPHQIASQDTADGTLIVIDGLIVDRIPLGVQEPRPKKPAPYKPRTGVEGLTGSGFPEYLSALYTFVRATRSEKAALKAVETLARASPLVAHVFRDDGAVVIIDRKTRHHYEIGTAKLDAGKAAPHAEAIAERIDLYANFLAGGGVVLALAAEHVFVPPARVSDALLPTLRLIAHSSTPDENRLRKLWEASDIGLRLAAALEPGDDLTMLINDLSGVTP